MSSTRSFDTRRAIDPYQPPLEQPTSPPGPASVRGEPAEVRALADRLDAERGGSAARVLTGGPAGSPLRLDPPTTSSTADAIRASAAYSEADPALQAQLEALLVNLTERGNADDLRALLRILAAPCWAQASAEERVAIVTVCAAVPLRALDNVDQTGVSHDWHQGGGQTRPLVALALLAERDLGGRPALLDRAHGGRSLAGELAALVATAPDQTVLTQTGARPAEILGGLILEIADSGRIAQGNVGTCGATTLQLQLVESNPAEYARLCAGLLSAGRVTLRNGDTLTRDGSSIAPTPGNCRTPSERLFQSAVMEYGSPADYQVRRDAHGQIEDVHAGNVLDRLPLWARVLAWIFILPGLIMHFWPLEAGGLTGWEYDRAAQGLFGEDFSQRYSAPALGLQWPHSGASQLARLAELRPDGDFARQRVGVSVLWNDGGHFLSLERVEAERVVLHNPWGSAAYGRVGQPVSGAPDGVVWVDPQRGLIAWPRPDFEKNLSGIYYPSRLG